MRRKSTEYWREVGRRLREAREAKRHADGGKWTLVDAANASGLTKTRINNYEHGIRKLNAEEAAKLGEAYGVKPAWLLLLDEVSTLVPRQQAILFVFDRAKPDGQDSLLLVGASHAGIHTATTASEVEKIALEHQGTKAVIEQTGVPGSASGPGKHVVDNTGEERAGLKRARRKRS